MQILPSTADYIAQQVRRHEVRAGRPRVAADQHRLRLVVPALPARSTTTATTLLALAAYNAGEGKVDEWYRDASASGEDFEVADPHPVPGDPRATSSGCSTRARATGAEYGRELGLDSPMNERRLGRTGLSVSEIGYGAWGIGGEHVARRRGRRVPERRCTARSTSAWTSSTPRSPTARALASSSSARSCASATSGSSSPARSRRRTCIWPAPDGIDPDEAFPADHVRKCTERSLSNLGMDAHRRPAVPRLERRVGRARELARGRSRRSSDEGKIRFFGVSINDHQPANAVEADRDRRRRHRPGDLQRLRPVARGRAAGRLRAHDVGVIVRVPFDEGALTGRIGAGTSSPRATSATTTSAATARRAGRRARGGDPRRPRHRAGASCQRSRCATSSAARRSRR